MAIFISKSKLAAAASSMHQFCPVVREVFLTRPNDVVIESVTVFLYGRVAEDIFGRRFSAQLVRKLRGQARFGSAQEIDARVHRINRHFDLFSRVATARHPHRSAQEEFTDHVRSVIKAVLAEAGFQFDDAELIRETFPRFQDALRVLKAHLRGIQKQARYVMR